MIISTHFTHINLFQSRIKERRYDARTNLRVDNFRSFYPSFIATKRFTDTFAGIVVASLADLYPIYR